MAARPGCRKLNCIVVAPSRFMCRPEKKYTRPSAAPTGVRTGIASIWLPPPESCSHRIAFFPLGVDFLLLKFICRSWLPGANHYAAVTYMQDDMAAEMHTKGLGL